MKELQTKFEKDLEFVVKRREKKQETNETFIKQTLHEQLIEFKRTQDTEIKHRIRDHMKRIIRMESKVDSLKPTELLSPAFLKENSAISKVYADF